MILWCEESYSFVYHERDEFSAVQSGRSYLNARSNPLSPFYPLPHRTPSVSLLYSLLFTTLPHPLISVRSIHDKYRATLKSTLISAPTFYYFSLLFSSSLLYVIYSILHYQPILLFTLFTLHTYIHLGTYTYQADSKKKKKKKKN